MKYLYFLLITTLFSSFSYAQADLFVSNGSYVFVDGTGFTDGDPLVAPLFVTDDVNLDTNGHIYLRNDAQLLQGNNIGNSGSGQLSVYQTGTSNTYMYNYWCSPIGRNTGVAGNTGFRPNNNIYGETAAPITSLPATYVAETNYNGVAGSPPTIASYWLFSFTGTSAPPNQYQDWVSIDETTSNLASGYGWTMKGNPSSSQQYDFRGRPNNGTISTTLNANRQTLVGNPYPSSLDARAYIHDTNNAAIINSATLSFWEQDPSASTSHVLTNYHGGYATYTINASGPVVEVFTPATFNTYNSGGNLNVTGGSSTTGKSVFRYIPIGQGFMVEGNGTGGTLITTNAMRVFQKEAAPFSEFFRASNSEDSATNQEASYNENGLSIMPEGYKRFRLNIDFNETYTRQLAQTFHHTATAGEDYGLETHSPAALAADAYWPQGEKAFNAQAFAFNVELQIPMIINIDEQQLLRFRIFDIQNFDDSQPIYLHDTETNSYIDLRQQNYELNLEEGLYDNRFEITFRNEDTLSNENISISDFIVFQDNNNSQLTIKNPNNLDINSVSLFDVSGKQVFNAIDLDIKDVYRFSTNNLSDGIYVTVIGLNNNDSLSKKVVIKNN